MAVYTSFEWHVTPGREDEFVQAWMKFAQLTRRDVDPAAHAKLLRDSEDPSHFISVGEWRDLDTIEHWRQSMGFEVNIAKLESMTESMKVMTLDVAADTGSPA